MGSRGIVGSCADAVPIILSGTLGNISCATFSVPLLSLPLLMVGFSFFSSARDPCFSVLHELFVASLFSFLLLVLSLVLFVALSSFACLLSALFILKLPLSSSIVPSLLLLSCVEDKTVTEEEDREEGDAGGAGDARDARDKEAGDTGDAEEEEEAEEELPFFILVSVVLIFFASTTLVSPSILLSLLSCAMFVASLFLVCAFASIAVLPSLLMWRVLFVLFSVVCSVSSVDFVSEIVVASLFVLILLLSITMFSLLAISLMLAFAGVAAVVAGVAGVAVAVVGAGVVAGVAAVAVAGAVAGAVAVAVAVVVAVAVAVAGAVAVVAVAGVKLVAVADEVVEDVGKTTASPPYDCRIGILFASKARLNTASPPTASFGMTNTCNTTCLTNANPDVDKINSSARSAASSGA